MTTLNSTPNALRTHIGIFGKRNVGKSSLINAITNQPVALVSDVPGTTTDPVYKPMEVYPLGPCVFIDTAGFDDQGELGELRNERTGTVLAQCDMALLVFSPEARDFTKEVQWLASLQKANIPTIAVITKKDAFDCAPAAAQIHKLTSLTPVLVSSVNREGIDALRKAMIDAYPRSLESDSICGHLISQGDHVLLVAPQDIQAPKGRLILPQVQTIRDLLDHKAIVTIVTTDGAQQALSGMKSPPKLIITDSQVFDYVSSITPKGTLLTSFSVLMARMKGDIDEFVQGAQALDTLHADSRILIAESCTHAPLEEDIGREKIPRMLRKKFGDSLQIDHVSGNDFPADLSPYSLVIHCGGCMFNRKHILSRIAACKDANVPITNYGIFIAKIKGILDKVTL